MKWFSYMIELLYLIMVTSSITHLTFQDKITPIWLIFKNSRSVSRAQAM